MTNINIQIKPELHKKLKFEALEKDTTLKNLIIEILEKKTK